MSDFPVGQVVALKPSAYVPILIPISIGALPRDTALSVARQNTSIQCGWIGPRQVIFLHCDGTMELWDKELRE